ncbi:hypothetical protein X801_08850, partial [Opisthorchis viverrini]
IQHEKTEKQLLEEITHHPKLTRASTLEKNSLPTPEDKRYIIVSPHHLHLLVTRRFAWRYGFPAASRCRFMLVAEPFVCLPKPLKLKWLLSGRMYSVILQASKYEPSTYRPHP